ncbi:MAG: hypothetical protein P1U67_03880 [Alcanivoracaceae bacterium]|nr:hypothetical protein [Alcanivoracaceae bacterium]
MAQLALAMFVIAIVLILAIACWRAGQKTLAVLAFSVAALMGAGYSFYAMNSRVPSTLPTESVKLIMESANLTGVGWRLTGSVTNVGDKSVSAVNASASVALCDGDTCKQRDSVEFVLLMHVPPGQTYPFHQALHDVKVSSNDISHSEKLVWTLTVESVLGYANQR